GLAAARPDAGGPGRLHQSVSRHGRPETGRSRQPCPLRDRFIDRAGFDAWVSDYRTRLRAENSDDARRRAAMQAVNPRYVLRNYLVQRAIEQAEQGDYAEIDRLLVLLSRPFDDQPGMQAYASEPPDRGRHLEVSCSS
ncbi:MAG: protein adenylyltransferase SelO family protein, partial [Sedimenticolaceae bacterium]